MQNIRPPQGRVLPVNKGMNSYGEVWNSYPAEYMNLQNSGVENISISHAYKVGDYGFLVHRILDHLLVDFF